MFQVNSLDPQSYLEVGFESVSGFGCWVLGVGCRVSGCASEAKAESRFRVPAFGFRARKPVLWTSRQITFPSELVQLFAGCRARKLKPTQEMSISS